MSRVVIGLDCGSIIVLPDGASLRAIEERVNARINETAHNLLYFQTEDGAWRVNAGAINFIRETDEYS